MEQYEEEHTQGPTASYDDDRRHQGWKLEFSIEIPLILIMFASTIAGAPISNLIMYRTCVRSLGHDVEECRSFLEAEAIDHSQELETEVQEYATFVTTVKAVLEGAGPAVLSLFIGVWSDMHGRKPLIVWPIFGMTLSAMLMVIYSMADGLGPWWSIATSLPATLGGSFIVLVTGVYCYVSDVTNTDNRSIRIVLIQVSIAGATTVGGLVSPYLLQALGTGYLLLLVAAIQTAAYAFTAVVLIESMTNTTQGSILTLFNTSHVVEMVKACFQKKPNYGRAIILLSIGASTLSIFTVYGSHILLYLYSRNRIQWTMEDFTTFSSVSAAMWFMGSFFGVAVVQKRLHISDLNFVAISFMSCVVEFAIKTYATTTWEMYLGSTISLFGTISGPLIRSFLTKTLPSTDIAKVFGFMAATDAFLPLLSPVVYNALYAATITTFPQSIMLLTCFINVCCFVLIMTVRYLNGRITTSYQTIESE